MVKMPWLGVTDADRTSGSEECPRLKVVPALVLLQVLQLRRTRHQYDEGRKARAMEFLEKDAEVASMRRR